MKKMLSWGKNPLTTGSIYAIISIQGKGSPLSHKGADANDRKDFTMKMDYGQGWRPTTPILIRIACNVVADDARLGDDKNTNDLGGQKL